MMTRSEAKGVQLMMKPRVQKVKLEELLLPTLEDGREIQPQQVTPCESPVYEVH